MIFGPKDPAPSCAKPIKNSSSKYQSPPLRVVVNLNTGTGSCDSITEKLDKNNEKTITYFEISNLINSTLAKDFMLQCFKVSSTLLIIKWFLGNS